jgi:hypothetical protein
MYPTIILSLDRPPSIYLLLWGVVRWNVTFMLLTVSKAFKTFMNVDD